MNPLATNKMEEPNNTNGHSNTNLSPEVLKAIYGTVEDKKAAYEESLRRYAMLVVCVSSAVHVAWRAGIAKRRNNGVHSNSRNVGIRS